MKHIMNMEKILHLQEPETLESSRSVVLVRECVQWWNWILYFAVWALTFTDTHVSVDVQGVHIKQVLVFLTKSVNFN